MAEFIDSCKKYGIKPGFYYSTGCNAYMKFDQHVKGMPSQDSEEFKKYHDLVEQQLTELWTNYGELFQVWFDGGHFAGEPDTKAMLEKMQPNAVAFQGPDGYNHNLRWVGNEQGFAPDNCWSTIQSTDHYDGTKAIGDKNAGDPDGKIWQPAETDTPNREFQWFWYENQEYLVVPAEKLVRYYYESVGRNTNLLLGMVIDDRGLVPEKDEEEFTRFGWLIKERFSNPLGRTNGEGMELTIEFDKPTLLNQIVLMEDIQFGHIVRKYDIEIDTSGEWLWIAGAQAIGHKRIHLFDAITTTKIRFKCTESKGTPQIRDFSVYKVNPLPKLPGKIMRYIRYGLKRIFKR